MRATSNDVVGGGEMVVLKNGAAAAAAGRGLVIRFGAGRGVEGN